jgi:hypothetical protein
MSVPVRYKHHSTAPDRLQPPLLRRFRFRRQVSLGVRRRNSPSEERKAIY